MGHGELTEHNDYFSHCFICYSKHLHKVVPRGKVNYPQTEIPLDIERVIEAVFIFPS